MATTALIDMPPNEIGAALITCRSCGREYRKIDLDDIEYGHILDDEGCPSDDCPGHTPNTLTQ